MLCSSGSIGIDGLNDLHNIDPNNGIGENVCHIPASRNDDGAGENRSIPQIIKNAAALEQRTEKIRKHRHRR